MHHAVSDGINFIVILCLPHFCRLSPAHTHQAQMQWLTQLRYIAASYYSLEALLINEHTNSWLDCSNGLAASQVDMITANLVNTPDFQKAVLQQFKEPQPGWVTGSVEGGG